MLIIVIVSCICSRIVISQASFQLASVESELFEVDNDWHFTIPLCFLCTCSPEVHTAKLLAGAQWSFPQPEPSFFFAPCSTSASSDSPWTIQSHLQSHHLRSVEVVKYLSIYLFIWLLLDLQNDL